MVSAANATLDAIDKGDYKEDEQKPDQPPEHLAKHEIARHGVRRRDGMDRGDHLLLPIARIPALFGKVMRHLSNARMGRGCC
jgi:hypothetical protein